MARTKKQLRNTHPGEVLKEEFLNEFKISQYRLAKDTSVPATRIAEIVKGARAITSDTALRFAAYFGTSPEFWMNLQAAYDLENAHRKLDRRISQEVRPLGT